MERINWLEAAQLELVKMRASQINGCAYCIDMHTRDARAAGETEQRLYLLDAWREAPRIYSKRERAALAWTESVTRITDGHAPDAAYAEARAIRRCGAGGPHAGYRLDQRLEPAQHRVPHAGGRLSTRNVRQREVRLGFRAEKGDRSIFFVSARFPRRN